MNAYAHWTPDSGTTELPRSLKGPFWETRTVELHLLDLQPAVTRYTRQPSLSARLLVLWLRILASPAAEHLRASTRSTFAPLVVGAGILLGVVLINYAAADWFATTDGFRRIPIDGLGR